MIGWWLVCWWVAFWRGERGSVPEHGAGYTLAVMSQDLAEVVEDFAVGNACEDGRGGYPMSHNRSAFLSPDGEARSRSIIEAAERRRADDLAMAVRHLQRDAMSDRSTEAFFRNMARNEPDERARKAHIENAETFMRRAQVAEAQIARAMPADKQRALVPNHPEKTA